MAAPTVNWRKRILIPFWVIRIAIMLFVIAASAIYLAALKRSQFADVSSIAIVVVFLLLMVSVLLMDVLSIIMFARDALGAPGFLITNVLQTAIWTVVVVLNIVAVAQYQTGEDSPTVGRGMGFIAFVYLSFIGLLIYASINYHKHRKNAKRGHYVATPNPAMPTHLQGHGQTPIPAPAYGTPPYAHQNTSYHSQTSGQSYGVEMHSQPHQQHHGHGEAANYYNAQPAKPAQMV